ncbi:MAG: PEP-CTERM sorting domain-containing protein [Tepidisphaeraceae bacterium]|jgi:T5SS/PEP-CTERM-associated repeat protein
MRKTGPRDSRKFAKLLAGAIASAMPIVFMSPTPAAGTTFYYVGPDGGNWNNAANWSGADGGNGGAGIPNNGDDAILDPSLPTNIEFDDNYDIGLDSLILNAPASVTLNISLSSGDMAIDNTSTYGGLYIGKSDGGLGTIELGGTATFNDIGNEEIGFSGVGEFIQTGGTHTVDENSTIYLGRNAGSVGIYAMTGGVLTDNGNLSVGYNGTGKFSQTNGTVTVGNNLFIGDNSFDSVGTYTISNGSMTAGFIGVGGEINSSGGSAVLNVNGGTVTATTATDSSAPGYINVWDQGSININNSGILNAAVLQNDGIVNVNSGTMNISSAITGDQTVYQYGGTINLAGDAVINNDLNVSNGTLQGLGELSVGNNGTGSVEVYDSGSLQTNGDLLVGVNEGDSGAINQTGGTVTLGTGPGSSSLTLGDNEDASGNYYMDDSNGTSVLNVNGNLFVGQGGNGTFTQNAGTVNVNEVDEDATTGYVAIAAGSESDGSYTITNGTLNVAGPDGVQIGGSPSGSGGTGDMTINAYGTVNANVTVYNPGSLTVNPNGTLFANTLVNNGQATNAGGSIFVTSSISGSGNTNQTSGYLYIYDGGIINNNLTISGGSVVGGGTLNVGDGGAGTVTVSNSGSLTTYNDLVVGAGDGDNGAIVQTGGNVQVGQYPTSLGSLYLGQGAGSTGSYYMDVSTGSSTLAIQNNLYVGYDGAGTFTQNGGTVEVLGTPEAEGSGNLEIAADSPNSTGTYTLNGGTLEVESGDIDVGGNTGGAQGTGTLDLGANANAVAGQYLRVWSSGTVNQNGGVLNVGQDTTIDGALNVNSGTLNSPGSAEDTGLEVESDGTLTIKGGNINVIGSNNPSANDLRNYGTINLDGGTITAGEMVNNGTVNDEGGTLIVDGAITGTGTTNVSSGGTVTIPSTGALASTVSINNGSVNFQGNSAAIGSTNSATTAVTVTGTSSVTVPLDLLVAPNGSTATLSTNDTTTVVVPRYLIIGSPGGSGDVTVGGQSTIDPLGAHLNDLNVTDQGTFTVENTTPTPGNGDDPVLDNSIVGGYNYNGALNVSGSGTVNTPNIKLGVTGGYTGTVNQTGGTINVTTFGDGNDGTQTGGGGSGVANISGGTLNAGTVLLGSSAGGNGSATFSGASSINVTGNMNVGSAGGTGTATSMGTSQIVIGGVLNIGGTGGSGDFTATGNSNVDPTGAHLNDLNVEQNAVFTVESTPAPQGTDPVLANAIVGGYQYNGAMNVQGSGTVYTPTIKLGVTQGFTGTVNQTGGTINVTTFGDGNDGTQTGGAGMGVANISGGTLNATTILLGSSAGGNGSATFSGASNINVTGDMNVGSPGGTGSAMSMGTSQIVIGGILNIGGTGGSGQFTAAGNSNVDPTGAHLNDLTVQDNAVFTIENTTPPDGTDPVLANSIVGGYQYNGAMSVQGSGAVYTPTIKLGVTQGFTGTVNQTGGTINVTTFGDGNDGTQTGGAGMGMADISGGTLNADTILLGSSAGGSGNADFSGSSNVNVTGNVNVGSPDGGSGTITSDGNANVVIGGILTIGGSGGSGDVSVSGNSSWDPTGAHLNDLNVSGSGTFIVPDSPLPPPQGVDPVIYDSIVAGYQYNGALNVSGQGTVSAPNIKIGVTQGVVGTYNQSGGTVTTSNFLADNGAGSVVNFSAGTLNTGGTTINTGVVFNVGDGTHTAILNLVGGTHSFANGLNIEANSELTGTGTVEGNVTSEGTIAPGTDPGTIDITGNLTNTGGLDISLASPTDFDELNVTGTANLGGTIYVSLLDGYMPELGNTFNIGNFGSIINDGYKVALAGWNDPGLSVAASNTGDELTLTVVVPEPASGSLLTIGLLGALGRRRRKSRRNQLN